VSDHYKTFYLHNKVAVITGASDGIGRGIAIGLAEAGADIIICSRREEKLLEVKEIAEKHGRKAEICIVDVQRISEIEKLKAFIKATTGKVDILINNAGYAVTKPAWDTSEDDWDKRLILALKACFFAARLLAQSCVSKAMGKSLILALRSAEALCQVGPFMGELRPELTT